MAKTPKLSSDDKFLLERRDYFLIGCVLIAFGAACYIAGFYTQIVTP